MDTTLIMPATPGTVTTFERSRLVEFKSSIQHEQRAKLFNPVVMLPVSDVLGFNALPNISNMVFVDSPKGRTLVNTCSKNFSLIPIQDWLPQFEEYLDSRFDFKARYTHRNFSHFNIEYVAQIPVEARKLDMVFPKISISYGYDSSSLINVTGGLFRLICTNGMNVPVEGADEIFALKRRHMGNFGAEELLQHLIGAVDKIQQLFPEYVKTVNVLGDRAIENWNERLLQVVAGVDYPARLVEVAETRYQFEKETYFQGQGDNDWFVYNGLNYPLSNNFETLKMDIESRAELDSKIFRFMLENPN